MENLNNNLLSHQQIEDIEKLERQKNEKQKKADEYIFSIGMKIAAVADENKNVWIEDEREIKIAICRQQAIEIQECIVFLEKIKEEIEELDKKIAYIQNLILCPKCGKEIEKESVFCRFCGHYLKVDKIEKASDGSNRCISCGFTLTDDAVYCPNCGEKVNRDICKSEENVDDEKNITVRKCKVCGNILDEDAIFCNECGTQYLDD